MTIASSAPNQRFVHLPILCRCNRLPSECLRWIVLLGHVPLVLALETLAEFAARFGELHLGAEVGALGALVRHGLVPDDEIAALVRARVERGAAFARAALHELAAILGAEHARGHRPRAATLRERAAAEELAAAALANHHRRAAEMTLVLRHHRLRALALERPCVLALLRMILAGEERSEEAAARLELTAAVWATEIRNF